MMLSQNSLCEKLNLLHYHTLLFVCWTYDAFWDAFLLSFVVKSAYLSSRSLALSCNQHRSVSIQVYSSHWIFLAFFPPTPFCVLRENPRILAVSKILKFVTNNHAMVKVAELTFPPCLTWTLTDAAWFHALCWLIGYFHEWAGIPMFLLKGTFYILTLWIKV